MPHQQPRSRTGRTPCAARLVRGAAVAGSLALLPLTAACSGGEGEAADGSKASKSPAISAVKAGVVAPAKVEVIASLTGCKPKIRIEADELRQGVCHTKAVDYLVTTFPEERFKETWLESASMYRADFLVGPRWIISAKIDALKKFRTQTGGDIVSYSGMGPSTAPSPS
ncbi:hypothetical protein OG440_39760 (plasmid) [Streptomyces sp. NBC_00637]|uniref:hypothetical protein n=1 Tax=Streptomyces sp. NBC_00637 TaxID=2903667 RepID=UPI002F914934